MSVMEEPRSCLAALGDLLMNRWRWARVGRSRPEQRARCLYFDAQAPDQPARELRRTELPPKPAGRVRLVVASDTHSQHSQLGRLPAGDVFVHCGDWLMSGRLWSVQGQLEQLERFNAWLGEVPCDERLVVGGNHDQIAERLGPAAMQRVLSNGRYLCNSAAQTSCGLRVFGSPASRGRSRNSAFQSPEFHAEAAKAAAVETSVDVLVTHGESEPWAERMAPRVHCWGHVHGAHGVRASSPETLSVCGAIMDTRYNPTHLPIVVDVQLQARSIWGKATNCNSARGSSDEAVLSP